MTTVLTLTRPTEGRWTLPEDVMEDIRWRMHDFDAADIAALAGVSRSCIYAIRRGKTKWPRGTTLFPLLRALDIELVLVDRKTKQPLRRRY